MHFLRLFDSLTMSVMKEKSSKGSRLHVVLTLTDTNEAIMGITGYKMGGRQGRGVEGRDGRWALGGRVEGAGEKGK